MLCGKNRSVAQVGFIIAFLREVGQEGGGGGEEGAVMRKGRRVRLREEGRRGVTWHYIHNSLDKTWKIY